MAWRKSVYSFPRIIDIPSYILCSELIHHLCEIFTVTPGAPNPMEEFFLEADVEIHAICAQLAQLAQQFMRLNSFICLTYHLSENLKIRDKFYSTTYADQTFWFHLCCMHSSCPYSPLNKIMCFVLVNST